VNFFVVKELRQARQWIRQQITEGAQKQPIPINNTAQPLASESGLHIVVVAAYLQKRRHPQKNSI